MTDLAAWLTEPEGERLEFKEARRNYHFEKLVDYCVALANEGGGRIILGVSDKRPRRIVGTQAFAEPGRTVAGLMERLPLRIDWTELRPPEGRVLVFEVPGRPVGMPIERNGRYLARSGDELRAMAPDELRRIFAEGCVDFSAELHPRAGIADLDPDALERFRRMWRKKSGNAALARLSYEQLLADAELVLDGRVTLAALILLGTEAALGRFLPQAELVFEFRTGDHSVAHQHRVEYRRGFLSFLEDLWETINLRNVAAERQLSFSVEDLFVLDALQRQVPIPLGLKTPLWRLTEHGVVERIGRGRGVRFVLSRKFYSFLGREGVYAREQGLDRNTRKALLVQHIETAGREGARLQDLRDVLRDQSRAQIQTLLRELRADGQVVVSGLTRGARWFPSIRPL